MQKLALLFLMAITASMMFSLNVTVFAQNATETPDDTMPDQETTDEGSDATTEEDTTSDDEEMTENDTDNETMEEPTMETTMAMQSPLQQLMGGTDPHTIQCGDGLQLVYKASNFRPACVKDSTYQVLLQRGWASASTPSDDDLMGMVSNLPKPTVDETTDETPSDNVNIEEGVNVEGESTTGNDTNPNPQSYSINLSESMEMGAN